MLRIDIHGGIPRNMRNGLLMLTIAEHALKRGHAPAGEALLRTIAERYPVSLEGLAARSYLRAKKRPRSQLRN